MAYNCSLDSFILARWADLDAVAVTLVILTVSLQGHIIEEQAVVR